MKKSHWNKHAYQWAAVGAPLKPCNQDVQRFEKLIQTLFDNKPPETAFNAMLLGVTPEIANLTWPLTTHLVAVDRMMDMIEEVWRPNVNIKTDVICADWLQLPLKNHWADLVIGDGCFTFFNFPDQYQKISEQLKNMLSKQGYLLLRLFVQAEQAESSVRVFEDLQMGKITNFHIFKWRLAMSLQQDVKQGVRVGDIWQAWHDMGESAESLSVRLGWPIEEINTINSYQHSDSIYYYPSADAIRQLLHHDFDECGFFNEKYELAERCPIMLFRVKDE